MRYLIYFHNCVCLLLDCLFSLVAEPINIPIPHTFEIIVIDNELGKIDKTRLLLRRPNFIMANRKNRNSVRRRVTVAGR